MGNSVTKKGLTENLEALQSAGMGGVQIVPIYGEKGDEGNFIKYLSPEWMEMLKHTVSEAERLGMGVDMSPCTGWPMGDPNVTPLDAAKAVFIRKIALKEKTNVRDCLKEDERATLVSLAAYDKEWNYIDITSYVNSEGIIEWKPVDSDCKIYAMFWKPTGQMVKRAAPGGEGLVIDYFNKKSFLKYFNKFPSAFSQAGISKGKVRAFYNDSYEIYGANWTTDLLDEFKNRRGYDLRPYIRYLGDTAASETRQRLVTDYSETWSDMLYDVFTRTWIDESHKMGMITRNAAHKAPANWLDLYALADIPETEAYGTSGINFPGLRKPREWNGGGGPSRLMMKFASSAANVNGRKLVSSETATWLDDHFMVSLSQVKPQVDQLFRFRNKPYFFHGMTYTPLDKPFPGRLWYAGTIFGPTSHFWKELPALNRYIAECQTVLQNSMPDNDILLYWPIHEMWSKQKSELIIKLIGPQNADEWFFNTSFGKLAQKFLDKGYTFDYVSDRMIKTLRVDGKSLVSGNAQYKAIVVPDCEMMPVETLSALLELAKQGAKILFEGDLPKDVPGLLDLEKRKTQALELIGEMSLLQENISSSSSLFERLSANNINPEEMVGKGLKFIRKKVGDDRIYFIANQSDKFGEEWITIQNGWAYVEIFDPVSERRGNAAIKNKDGATEIYLQLEPGESCILTCSNKKLNNRNWVYLKPVENKKFEVRGDWKLTPKEGAPVIPPPVSVKEFGSWTAYGGDYETFSGKAVYSTSFEVARKNLSPGGYILDLGNVRETARVKINGKDIGLIWCFPNRLIIPKGIIKQKNTIEIEVTNLSINRIINMDKKGINGKIFMTLILLTSGVQAI